MPNNIAVSVTADVADLQVKRAIMSAELRTATKDLNDFAKEAAKSGQTDALRTSMLAAGDAVARTRNQIRLVDSELRDLTGTEAKVTAAVAAETVAEEANTVAHGSNRAAREALVLVHEALSGNYHRMVGSLMIETQALAGAERSAAAFSAILTPMGLGIIGAGVALAAGVIAARQYEEAQAQLVASSIGVAAASGLTTDQLQAAGQAAADWSGRSRSASTEAAEGFAAAGIRSQAVITQLSGDVAAYAALTGQKAADAQKALADAMQDPIKGAQMLHDQLGILDGAQLEQIRTMVEAGDKTAAVSVITEAFQRRIDAAREAGVGANGVFGTMGASLSNLWGWFGKVTAAAEAFEGKLIAMVALGPQVAGAIDQVAHAHERAAVAAQRQAAQEAQLNGASAAAAAIARGTPEGQASAGKSKLEGDRAVLQRGLAADIRLRGEHSEAVQRDRAALDDVTRAIDTYLPAAEKAHRIAVLDAQLAEAKHGHDKGRVADLTRQRELLNHAGEVMSTADANQAANDAANVAEDRTNSPKGHKVDAVSQWQEQLREQQVASKDYFRDQTADELAFWQGKLALTQKGSHDWIEVQGHIYEASRTLAHQDYDEHLAAINEKLEADRTSWSKEQADWTEKLAFIRGAYGDQSKEYRAALAEQDRARREHDKQELADTERTIRESTQALKAKLTAQTQIREAEARTNESVIRADSSGSPVGEVAAAAKIGAQNAALNQQRLADLAAFHAAETAQLDAAIAAASVKYKGDEDQYRALLTAKRKADEDYANQKAELEAKSRQQSVQDILAVQSAYRNYTDGLASSAVTGFDGVLSHQKTWAQAGIGVYQNLARSFEQQLTKMLSSWIVNHLLMTATQRAQIAVQTATHAAGETAKTVATTVGGEARVAATASASGQAAAITGMHNLREITSHAAAAAAAAYHAMAGIPVVGPVLGAAAAAATFAAVEGFGALASFAVGTNNVPNDMIAQIHAGERIIPAADNRELMSAVKGGGSRSGGDMHLTYAPQLNGDTPSFRDQLHDHKDELMGIFRGLMRSGALRPA